MQVDSLKSLALIRGEIKTKSLGNLKQLLIKEFPDNLTELKIVSSVHSPSILENLLTFIKQESCDVTSLSFVACKLSQQAINTLSTILDKLTTLDISHNELRPQQFR